MDEQSIARAAVSRGLDSEVQLRECREIAAGGRSLLAILIEMGYLRAEDLETLFAGRPATPAPRRGALGWVLLGALPAFGFGLIMAWASVRPQVLRDPALSSENERLHRELAAIRQRSEVAMHIAVVFQTMAMCVDPANAPEHKAIKEAFRKLPSIGPAGDHDLILARGQAAELVGFLDHARTEYEHLARFNPDAALGLARIHLQRSNWQQALEMLHRVEQLRPAWGRLHYWKGRLHHAQGLHEAARPHFARALECDPSLKQEIANFIRR